VYQSGAYEYGENGGGYGESSYGGSFRVFRLDKWYWKLLLALLVFGVIYLVLAIIGGIFALLAPVIVPLALIWIILSVVRNMRR
jgi:fatty acid desaturase